MLQGAGNFSILVVFVPENYQPGRQQVHTGAIPNDPVSDQKGQDYGIRRPEPRAFGFYARTVFTLQPE